MNKNRQDSKKIEGRIIIDEKIRPFDGAAAHICLENVSRQDSRSVLLAEKILPGISHTEGETIIRFELPIENFELINEKDDYSVNVWIDINNSGQCGENDLFNDENYPVLTRGFGRTVEIKIK